MRGRTVALASVAISVCAVAFILALIASFDRQGGGVGVRQAAACVNAETEHDCLPDIAMEDTSGQVWDHAGMTGQVVIVNFWATWCRPCLVEIPDLAQIHDLYAEHDLVLLGIMTDQPADDDLAEFSERTGLNYPVVRADAEILRAFDLPDVLPTTLVYDRGGELALRHRGVVTTAQLSELVDELLGHQPPAGGQTRPDEP